METSSNKLAKRLEEVQVVELIPIYGLPNSEYVEKLDDELQLALGVLNTVVTPISIEKWSKITGIEESELLILAKTFQIPMVDFRGRSNCLPIVYFDNQKVQESHKAISKESLSYWKNRKK